MNKKFELPFFTLCLLAFLSSCVRSTEEDFKDATNPTSIARYETQIQPIVNRSCATASCHSNPNPSAGIALTHFEQVKESFVNRPAPSDSWSQIEADLMPISAPLSSAEKELIQNWMEHQYPE